MEEDPPRPGKCHT